MHLVWPDRRSYIDEFQTNRIQSINNNNLNNINDAKTPFTILLPYINVVAYIQIACLDQHWLTLEQCFYNKTGGSVFSLKWKQKKI